MLQAGGVGLAPINSSHFRILARSRAEQKLLDSMMSLSQCSPFGYNSRMTYVDLQRRRHDHPFRPFRIRMVNNSVYDILEPWMVMVGETSAVIATQTRKDDRGFELALDWKTVSITHMLELSDLNPPKASGRQKRAS